MQKHYALLAAIGKDAECCDSELDKYRFDVLKQSLLKKYVETDADEELLHLAALNDFVQRNASMAASLDRCQPAFERILSSTRNRLQDLFLSEPDQCSIITLNSCLARGRPGPGSSRGAAHADFVGKMFNSRLSTTSLALYKHYIAGISERWLKAENTRVLIHDVDIVCGSNITTVPKDATKRRVIAVEPSLNMFYQLGAKDILEDLLRRAYRLDVSKQPNINKILACAGSIDGSNATIDLRNASDSFRTEIIEYLLPAEVFSVLDIIRSRYATIEGNDVSLQMFSTMGNGFTFPLMTLLFTVMLDEFLRERGDSYTPYRDGVFGDDIILPARYASEFISFLEYLGFVVNTDKSFTTGHFRESCGGDYFHGFDVRGVYIRRLTTDEDIYSAFNRICNWGVRNGVLVTNALLCLKGLVDFRPVPLDEADYAGFKIPSVFLTAPKRDGNGALIYKAKVPFTPKWKVRDSYINPHGAFIGALGGYVRDNLISCRIDSGRDMLYKVIKCKTPSWDFIPDARVTHGGLVFQVRELLSKRA